MHVKVFDKEELLEGQVLFIDKYLEWTSFDVVNKIRSQIKLKKNIPKIKVGHAGTLDPLATGLLIVCTGKKTKTIEDYQNLDKEYTAKLKLGETTPSFDLETEPDEFFGIKKIDKLKIINTVQSFLGKQEQMPPAFSAKRVNGKRAYNSARKGKPIDLKKASIEIKEIETLSVNLPYVEIRVLCSKGTYIRALARDIGKALDNGAHLVELRRTKIGEFKVEDSITIDFFEKLL